MNDSAAENAKQTPNLYLLGFMGTGKSVLGARLAKRLKMDFIDSDAEIEKLAGMKIREIFDKLGEDAFRKMERDFIESGHPNSNCVVSCGGGLPCRGDMPELVKSKGVSVVLFSSPEEIFERVSKNNDRPLLNCPDPLAKIADMLKERTPYYMRSGIAIAADKSLKTTEEHIARIYASHKREFLKKPAAQKL